MPIARSSAVFVLGAVAHLVLTFVWMRDGGFFDRPPTEDAAGVRMHAGRFLGAGRPDGALPIVMAGWREDHFPPPALPIVTALVAHATSRPVEGVVLWAPIAAFWLVFVFAAGWIVRRTVADDASWLAAALVVAAPGLIVYLRPLISQMPMAAATLMAFAHLLASERLSRSWHVVFAGLWAALALLLKNLAFLDLLGFAIAFGIASLAVGRTWRSVFRGAALFAAPIAILAAPWYVAHFEGVRSYAEFVTGPRGQALYSRDLPAFSLERWRVYPESFARFCTGLPAAVAAGLAIAWWAVTRIAGRAARCNFKDPGGVACLGGAALLSYVVMTFGQVHSDAYFVIGWIPVYSVVVATAVAALRGTAGRLARVLVVGLSVAMGACAYAPWRSEGPIVAIGDAAIVDRFDSRDLGRIARESGCRGRPDVESWPVAEFTEAATRFSGKPRSTIALVAKDDEHPRYLEWANVSYESARRGSDVGLVYVAPGRLLGGGMPEALLPFDLLCVDARLGEPDAIMNGAAASGVTLLPLLDRPVTAKWRFLLFGIRR
jgi:hypothetical protein